MLTNMGFEEAEARRALENALDDPELALKILQYDAERRKEKREQIESDVNPQKQRSPTPLLSNVPAVYRKNAPNIPVKLRKESSCDSGIQQSSATPRMEERQTALNNKISKITSKI
ncbi:uncharacterized protein LOC132759509 [Ruditapes philippinarum]|uniref:uncharacterized protein LOC132759509 n=1 Tax=Ruditapes philippinarum TaxID=129788 RepID=UPI00295BCC17|nr:uncharacterized protein LOC132759509 [Ruditapes philippinarum]